MITGKTSTGFAFALPENKLQDMQILRALSVTSKPVDERDPYAQVCALDELGNRLLGKDKYQKLLDHVTTEDGRQPPADIAKELGEIVSAFGDQGKN